MQFKIPNSFLIGVESIDAEHQAILTKISEVKESVETDDYDSLQRSLSKIGHMLKKHFSNEEMFMAKIEFPEREAHAREHEELLQRVAQAHEIDVADRGAEIHALLDAVFMDMGRSDIYLREFLYAKGK